MMLLRLLLLRLMFAMTNIRALPGLPTPAHGGNHVNCTLQKSSQTAESATATVCEDVVVPVCRTVQTVRMEKVTEDCEKQNRYCQFNFRKQAGEIESYFYICLIILYVCCLKI